MVHVCAVRALYTVIAVIAMAAPAQHNGALFIPGKYCNCFLLCPCFCWPPPPSFSFFFFSVSLSLTRVRTRIVLPQRIGLSALAFCAIFFILCSQWIAYPWPVDR